MIKYRVREQVINNRTRLTLIAGPIFSVLKNNDLPQNARQSLNIVNRNVNYLKQLTNQILDLSKKEVENLDVQISNFQFADMLRALVQDFQPFANYQKIEFTSPNNIHNTIQLSTDGEKLFIVLKNLLSNAFKYTNAGGKVSFDYVDMNDNIQITVQDTGRGITKENLKHIFNRYFQTNDPNAPIEGGTGIGLAVCKEYIEKIGGSIQVNSELGKGSTFVVQFPKTINDTPSDTSNLSFLQHISVEDTISNTAIPIILDDMSTILVVEDNLDICQYLQGILQNNYQLIFANNGEEALHQLDRHPKVDLILTDLMMPVMDGFALIENLKAQDKFRNIPIITLTARSEMSDKLQALRIGVDDYLVKPFNEDELKIRIENLLENKTNREQFLEEITDEEGRATIDTEPEMKASSKLSKEDNIWLYEVEQVVKKQITNLDFNVNQLCVDMAISSSQLYRKIKSLTGLSPKNYINQIRYYKAKQFLENQTYSSVKRIAYEVGFKDEKNFSRNFKKRYGKNPSEYLE
ncbi:MAG: ATP-binding protein [Saprospiraceae bacterium]